MNSSTKKLSRPRIGRISRKQYWASVTGLFILATLFAINEIQVGIETLLIPVAVLRLHDIDRSGWWTALVVLVEVLLVITAFVLLPNDLAFPLATLAALLIIIASVIWLGVVAGNPETNKYGDPPGSGAKAHPGSRMEGVSSRTPQ